MDIEKSCLSSVRSVSPSYGCYQNQDMQSQSGKEGDDCKNQTNHIPRLCLQDVHQLYSILYQTVPNINCSQNRSVSIESAI